MATEDPEGNRGPHPIITTERRIALPGGVEMEAYLAEPEDLDSAPGVLVMHEIFGLNADIRRIARRFASHGYVALVPDLFAGRGPRALCISRTLLGMQLGRGAVFEQLAAAERELGGVPRCDAERIAAAGFCMGGGFAILHALKSPRIRATAPFYGFAPREADALTGICPVVGSFGGRDAIFAPHGKRLQRNLTALGIASDVKIYPDAGHSFMSHHEDGLVTSLGKYGPMKVEYNEHAAEDAWQRMLAFFDEHLAA